MVFYVKGCFRVVCMFYESFVQVEAIVLTI